MAVQCIEFDASVWVELGIRCAFAVDDWSQSTVVGHENMRARHRQSTLSHHKRRRCILPSSCWICYENYRSLVNVSSDEREKYAFVPDSDSWQWRLRLLHGQVPQLRLLQNLSFALDSATSVFLDLSDGHGRPRQTASDLPHVRMAVPDPAHLNRCNVRPESRQSSISTNPHVSRYLEPRFALLTRPGSPSFN